MNKTQEQLEKLRKVAESSLNKTEELQKVLAQQKHLCQILSYKKWKRRGKIS